MAFTTELTMFSTKLPNVSTKPEGIKKCPAQRGIFIKLIRTRRYFEPPL